MENAFQELETQPDANPFSTANSWPSCSKGGDDAPPETAPRSRTPISEMGFSDRGADCKLLFGVSMFLPALWFSSRLTPGRRMLAFGTWVPQCNRRSTLNQGCLPIYEVTNAIVPAGTFTAEKGGSCLMLSW